MNKAALINAVSLSRLENFAPYHEGFSRLFAGETMDTVGRRYTGVYPGDNSAGCCMPPAISCQRAISAVNIMKINVPDIEREAHKEYRFRVSLCIIRSHTTGQLCPHRLRKREGKAFTNAVALQMPRLAIGPAITASMIGEDGFVSALLPGLLPIVPLLKKQKAITSTCLVLTPALIQNVTLITSHQHGRWRPAIQPMTARDARATRLPHSV